MTDKTLSEYLESHGKLIAKVGDKLSNLEHEYNIGERLENVKGYVRFLYFLNLAHDLMKHPYMQQKEPCNVLVMPYYELGSVGDFEWDTSNIGELKLCLKQMLFFTIVNFDRFGFIHGDLHAKNILLCKTDNHYPIRYKINETLYTVERSLYDIVIMDFENSVFDKNNLNLFYIDLTRFFCMLPFFIKQLDITDVSKCIHVISKQWMIMSKDFEKVLKDLFAIIDKFKLTSD